MPTALGFSELAYKQYCSESGVAPNEVIELVDAALISVAETYRTLGCHDQCAEMYKREILWATSTGLSTKDIATSWLSLAQAQRLISIIDSCTADCLKELLDYYEQYNYRDKSQKTRQELEQIKQTCDAQSDHQEEDNEQKDEEVGDSDKNTSSISDDETVVTQFLETLSSDSELEQCIGSAELMDEFQDTMKGKKSGKALCLKTNMKGETPLHVAAINGDMNHVVKLVEVLGHPVNVPDGAGWLPIHEAAFHDRSEIATYLLDHGAKIDDTGYPDDYSTPLFEAIHNGALTTALIFVNRGANLWHKNKQGEYLSNLLDQWEPTRHASGTFAEQRAKFSELLAAIRSRLGGDYDRWCNLKRETPENHSSDDSESSVAIKNNTSNQKSYSRHPGSGSRSSLCETRDSVPPISSKTKFNKQSLRSRNWDDLMVDLDQDENSQPSPPVKLKKSVNAVESYKQAMKAVGSSKTRFVDKCESSGNTDSMDLAKRRKTSHVIDANDNDWLILDEKPKGSRSVSSTIVKEHFDALNVKRGKCTATASSKNRSRQEDLEFLPQMAFTSTQNDNLSSLPPGPSSSVVGGSLKHLPPKSTSTPIKCNKQLNYSFKESSHSGKDSSVNTNNCLPPATVNNDQLKLPKLPTNEFPETTSYSVKVAFSDISVLVPVDSMSRSVSWLATEAYRRRQILLGFNSNIPITVSGEQLVRLCTRDRALLLPSDRLFSIIPVLSQSGSVVELLAELNESVVTQKPPTNPSNQHIQSHLNYESKSNKLPHDIVSPFLHSVIDKARNIGVVDLSNLSLEDIECCKLLGQLVRDGGIRVITELKLQGNSLTTDIIDTKQFSSMNCINLTDYLCQLSLHLVKLNLSMNLFNEQFFKRGILVIVGELMVSNLFELSLISFTFCSDVLMPRLLYLNLSYNPLLGCNIKQDNLENTNLIEYDLSTNHNNCWIRFIETILKVFPKLNYLNLTGCSLGGTNTMTVNYQNEQMFRSLST
ncbi:unnamed protein product, partial [Schistosoma margrebowiei]